MMSSYPPTSLCTTRYITLPTFDFSGSGGGGGGGGEGGGGVISAGSSPLSSTRPWEEHIQEISRELEVICGSPRNRLKDRLSLLSPRHRPPLTRHLSIGCMFKCSSLSPPGGVFTKVPVVITTPTMARRALGLLRVESQDPVHAETIGLYQIFQEPPHCHHRLVVRHEETQSRLNQQLSLVFPLRSEEVHHAKRPTAKYCEHRHSDSFTIQRQSSLKTGVLHKIPIDNRKPEDLFVCLIDDRLLRICADDDSESEAVVLEEVIIPTEVSVQSLVLSVTDSKWLYVQEREGGTMVADFSGTSAKYVPVFRENEAASQVEIFLRVPVEFDPEEVTVKTVDDRVVVTGSKRPVIMTIGEEVEGVERVSHPGVAGHAWTPPGCHFVVILQLPAGAESRTVSAYFTRPHQLLISGKLRLTQRRHSF